MSTITGHPNRDLSVNNLSVSDSAVVNGRLSCENVVSSGVSVFNTLMVMDLQVDTIKFNNESGGMSSSLTGSGPINAVTRWTGPTTLGYAGTPTIPISITGGDDGRLAIGSNVTTGSYSVAIGSELNSSNSSVTIGYNVKASGNSSIAIGTNGTVTGGSSVSIGVSVTNSGGGSVVIGTTSKSTGTSSVIIGTEGSDNGNSNCIVLNALGAPVTAQDNNMLVLGGMNPISPGSSTATISALPTGYKSASCEWLQFQTDSTNVFCIPVFKKTSI